MDRSVYEYISQQNNDPIIERRNCAISGEKFPMFQSDKDFFDHKMIITIKDTKFHLPYPTKTPENVMREMLLRRNERYLIKGTCAKTGKSLITVFGPDIVIWERDLRWTDEFNGCDYAQDIDRNKTFTQQFKQLLHTVPFPNLYNDFSENSDYGNHITYMKNCYMVFAGFNFEDVYYSSTSRDIKDSCDSIDCSDSSGLYQCINCKQCSNLLYAANTTTSHNSICMFDCHNCDHCIGCRNLIGKKFHIFNQSYTKEEYEKKHEQLMTLGHDYIKTQRESHQSERIVPQFFTENAENTIGDKVSNASNCFMCFNIDDIQDSKRCENGRTDMKDMYFAYGCGIHTSKNYQIIDTGGDGGSFLSTLVVHFGTNVRYSINCHGSSDLFGCIGLRNKQYCIFNKQYTKEEYEMLLIQLITHMQHTGEWGHFFHPSLSPFAYNHTIAQEFYPLTRQEALRRGYVREDKTIDSQIPDNAIIVDRRTPQAKDLIQKGDTESLKNTIFICEKSGRPYRIISQEYTFYTKNSISLPRKHPDIRHQERVEQRVKRSLYLRNCDKTGKQIVSVYSPNTPYKIYSQKAYQQELYG